jgi:hypothetical protein
MPSPEVLAAIAQRHRPGHAEKLLDRWHLVGEGQQPVTIPGATGRVARRQPGDFHGLPIGQHLQLYLCFQVGNAGIDLHSALRLLHFEVGNLLIEICRQRMALAFQTHQRVEALHYGGRIVGHRTSSSALRPPCRCLLPYLPCNACVSRH